MASVVEEMSRFSAASDYSVARHLFIASCLGRWPNTIFAMFVPYFDASRSGTEGRGTVVVAGWLSTGEEWLKFEREWNDVLEEFRVPYFHMKEFAHSRGAFEAGWKGEEGKRSAFLSALVGVIDRHIVAAFGCLMDCAVFSEVDRDFQVKEHFGNEYALLGRICVSNVRKWLYANQREAPNEYVFEDGDPRGRLTWLMESDGFPAPIFKPSRDRVDRNGMVIMRGLVPLQAADFIAYEMRKAWNDHGDAETIAELDRYRKSFLALGEICGTPNIRKCTVEDLRGICKVRNVPPRHCESVGW